MPYVNRYNEIGISERLKVETSELTSKELALHKQRQQTQGIAAAGLSIAGVVAWWIYGSTGSHLSDDEAKRLVLKEASQSYEDSSLRERFEAQFVQPIVVDQERSINGTRISGFIEKYNSRNAVYAFGQDCLSGTAYDTTPSKILTRAENEVSAIAAFAVRGDVAIVFSVSSAAPPLNFGTETGQLIPDQTTAETLRANGCLPTDGLVVNFVEHYANHDIKGLSNGSVYNPLVK